MSIPRKAHRLLFEHFGPLHWWPGETPFEILVGAVLTQNTAWTRVEAAIERIRKAGLLDPQGLLALPLDRLEELIRPAGTFRVKARYLRAVLEWLVDGYGGDVEAALAGDTMKKRRELLALRGVGSETADSILCYAGEHPIFVVDAYTRRVGERHGWFDGLSDYDEIREWFERGLPPDAATLNESHAEFVTLGKEYCRPRKPRCGDCPLRGMLPTS